MNRFFESSDLMVFSQVRWNFQRPQHLISSFSNYRRVFFIEEPLFHPDEQAELELHETKEKVTVIVPRLPETIGPKDHDLVLQKLIENLMNEESIEEYSVCFYPFNSQQGWYQSLRKDL